MNRSDCLRIASINVRGLNDRNKRLAVFEYFEKSHFSLVLLQETKTNNALENEIQREKEAAAAASSFDRPHACSSSHSSS